MTARLLVGDVFDRMAGLEPGTFDLIVTSPPFLALRSYLPDGHPDKAKEIGSEATPAEFIDTLLALTAVWRRLLAPHGSLVVELGDTYSGSGGAGGDYNPDGLRAGQSKFDGSNHRRGKIVDHDSGRRTPGPGWPLDKSLTGIPTLYTWSLAYGRNLLTGQPSPAGMWRIRTLKPWIRSNPSVGALGDKERPATTYITVATLARDRYFDLDAVRTRPSQDPATYTGNGYTKGRPEGVDGNEAMPGNAAGAPPLDWWHNVDAIIDDEIDRRAGKGANRRTAKGVDSKPRTGKSADRDGNWSELPEQGETNGSIGARGVHIRRRLEQAGILTTLDALDVSPKGYAGAHYAVWPPELVRLLIDEMCPRRVCTTCGQPSRRIVEDRSGGRAATKRDASEPDGSSRGINGGPRMAIANTTVGWSDCGHDTWRPGHVLDPFAGSGTTLAVATGMGRTATGIDLDSRNADLARERVGMFLDIDWGPTQEIPA